MKIFVVTTFAAVAIATGCAPLSSERIGQNTAASRANIATSQTPTSTPAANIPPQQIPFPEIQRISVADAKKAYDAGLAIMVDTHAPALFANERIESAINVPFNEVDTYLSKVPKDKMLITYCSCPVENTSAAVADQLIKKGHTNVVALKGGPNAWKEAGYPIYKRGGS